MKRIRRMAVSSILGLGLISVGIPAQAAEHGYYYQNDRCYRDNYYRSANYNRGYYDGGYYDRHESHAGRSAAIIGGSAAAGAVIGAAAGHGQGAAIGAVVGGIAGVVADQAVRRHDRR